MTTPVPCFPVRLAVVAAASGLASALAVPALGGGLRSALAAGVAAAVVAAASGHLLLRPLRHLVDGVTTPQLVTELDRRLQLAEWREARLGAIAAGAARASHDLRGTLSPALLAAERLQLNADPAIKRIGDITVRAVERAIELVRGSLDFARDGHQAAPVARFPLHAAVDEAVAAARAAMPGVAITATRGTAIEVSAVRENVVRSLGYMLRHCGATPATAVTVALRQASGVVTLEVAADCPIPAASAAAPFSPFGDAAGVPLAIARALARSNGGSVVLDSDAPGGPALRLSLPATAARPAAP